jgi:hypothetical protein
MLFKSKADKVPYYYLFGCVTKDKQDSEIALFSIYLIAFAYLYPWCDHL